MLGHQQVHSLYNHAKCVMAMKKPTGILYRNNVVSFEQQKNVVSFLRKLPKKTWQPNNRGRFPGKIRFRIGYGRSNQEEMPYELKHLVPTILESIKGSITDEEMKLFDVFKTNKSRVTINRYRKGAKLAAHKDPQEFKNAIVIGLTLCRKQETIRKMRFTQKEGDKKHTHDIETSANSVYIFFGDAYYEWKHESVGNMKQKGTVYSLSFRANC